MEISVKWIAIGILCFEISLCAAYYNEYIVEDLCKYGNETIIYETPKEGAGTLKATSQPPYKPNKNCTIIIKPPADRGIVLSIRKIDMREWRYFCHDYIKIYHSDRYTSPKVVCRFQFDLKEKDSFYTKGPMTIIYHVGPALFPAFTFEGGFTLTYTVVSEDLQDCVKKDTFRCANGRCIPNDLTCDGRNNCGDRSDESHIVCDSNPLGYLQKMDTVYIVILSVLVVCIIVSSAVLVSRRRGRRLVDTDSVSDQDEPTSRLAPFQAVHPAGYFISQNPAGPNSLYPQHSKVVQLEGGFTNPCYPHGVPQPPPPYSQ
ncbi:uncharacterized protein LOC129958847 [Argiope bruennichi]|uniref:uncharacterized protein LOC129958847 n=1 Tax=Argiope bruennichi TaxID=94029 RepID=UPI002493EFA6|nr:uncharacterized protein LOC129958847 [Argiope bruennichi]